MINQLRTQDWNEKISRRQVMRKNRCIFSRNSRWLVPKGKDKIILKQVVVSKHIKQALGWTILNKRLKLIKRHLPVVAHSKIFLASRLKFRESYSSSVPNFTTKIIKIARSKKSNCWNKKTLTSIINHLRCSSYNMNSNK